MYYFIGIKGTGMASLAIMMHDLGNEVMGSDLEKHFFTEDELIKRGIKILPFNPANIITASIFSFLNTNMDFAQLYSVLAN